MTRTGVAAQWIHGARVCVIPHPENNYLPHALRKRPLVIVTLILLLAKTLALGSLLMVPVPAELSTITVSRIVQLTNTERQRSGLAGLNVNPALTAAAERKAQDIIANDYFAHISPTGVTPWFWITTSGYDYQVAGENLAIDFVEAEEVVKAWIASPSHRDNILHRDYTETGVAVATGEYQGGTSTVVVHMFGKPAVETITQKTLGEVRVAPVAETKPAPDTQAPEAPRLLSLSGMVVKNEVRLEVRGEAAATVALSINDKEMAKTVIPASGVASVHLDLKDTADGALELKATSRDQAGNQSEMTTLGILKDTIGPTIEEKAVLIVSPLTDSLRAALKIPQGNWEKLKVTALQRTVEIRAANIPQWQALESLNDIELKTEDQWGNAGEVMKLNPSPAFYVGYLKQPLGQIVVFSQVIKRIALGIGTMVLGLLVLAVFIHIRIQRPAMIAQALLVMALAGVAFWL